MPGSRREYTQWERTHAPADTHRVPYAVGYAVLVPDDVFNAMRQLELEMRERYGSNPGLRQPPHVTVKAPFATRDLARHRAYLDALAQRTAAFDVELDGIAFFEERGGVAFLDVVSPNLHLTELTATILRDLAPEAAPSSYEAANRVHYHATLAFLDADGLERARRDYAAVRPRFRFRAERLGLFLGIGGPEWIVIRLAPLGASQLR